MTIDKAKLAPFAAFLGAVGYTLYPYIDPPAMIVASTDLPEKMKDDWFQPKITNASTRNPFAPRLEPLKTVAETVAPTADRSKGGPRPAPTGPQKPSFVSVGSDTAGLKLGAVLVGGSRPAAVINGSVFLVGDDVPTDPPGESRWKLVSIAGDSVDLVDFRSKRTVALPFQEPSTSPKGKATAASATKVATKSSKKLTPQDELAQLRDVLGGASDTLTPLPPGVTESLGRLIGADLKNGDIGALESFLGSSAGLSTTGGNAPKSGKPQ